MKTNRLNSSDNTEETNRVPTPDHKGTRETVYFHPHISGARLTTDNHIGAEEAGWMPLEYICEECGGSGLAIEGWDCEECDGMGHFDL